MTLTDFIKLVKSGAQPVVEFVKGIDSKESFAEKGMRARAVGARDEGLDVIRIEFDYTEFEGINLPLQSAAYFDKHRVPCLTAVQAGHYEPRAGMYIDLDEDLTLLFQPVTDGQQALYHQYLAATSGAETPRTYVAWLECELLALQAAGTA